MLGSIGPVQLQYATDAGFGTGNPAKGVASVLNASGDYAQPTPVDVASALAYATQLANGTHQLELRRRWASRVQPIHLQLSPHTDRGLAGSQGCGDERIRELRADLGQQKSPSIGYASLGLSLERYGIDAVTADVPGAVPVTAAEEAGYACGDLTPSEVAAGQTTPTCGVTRSNGARPPASGVRGSPAMQHQPPLAPLARRDPDLGEPAAPVVLTVQEDPA